MPKIHVRQLDVMAEALWSFRDSRPTWRHDVIGNITTFDPFPGYRHELGAVEETTQLVEQLCPPAWDVELYMADREEVGRSNGFSNVASRGQYVDGEWTEVATVGLIMLSGKRIPPHPALTRYLVSHEYGHNVEWMLQRARGVKNLHGDEAVTEYAKLRGLPEAAVHDGSGGRWHDSATEIFACDFRVLVCDVETDYWPHPGVPHPSDVLDANLASWWAQALDLLDEYRTASAKP